MPTYKVPNNYFNASTDVGKGIQSLAQGLFAGPDPLEMEQDRLKNGYLTAQTAHAQTQTDLGRAKLGAGAKISDFLRLATDPLADGENRADRIRGGMSGLGEGLSASGDIGQLAQVFRAAMANSGASDNDVIRAQAGAGGTVGVNDAVSLDGQANVASRNQRDLMQKTQYQEGQQTARNSADISAANARNAANNSAAMAREQWHLLNSPVNTGAGDTTTFAPNDPRGKGGPIHGRETETIVKAEQLRANGGQGGGQYEGTGIEAQDSNIILRGIKDPAFAQTPEYAMAYERQYATPKPQMTDQGLVMVTPTAPAWAPQPAKRASAAAPVTASGVVPGTEKAPSHDQGLVAGFARRLDASNAILDELDSKGESNPGVISNITGNLPVVGNVLSSENRQRLEQAKREFITAQLRRESGAAISDTEFSTGDKMYFPQPGDGPDVLKQKAASRRLARDNMVGASGRAYQPGPQAQAAPPKPDSGGIPTFSNPNDPALVAMPSGSVFYTPDGKLRTKP
jgi:hypothetical protein